MHSYKGFSHILLSYHSRIGIDGRFVGHASVRHQHAGRHIAKFRIPEECEYAFAARSDNGEQKGAGNGQSVLERSPVYQRLFIVLRLVWFRLRPASTTDHIIPRPTRAHAYTTNRNVLKTQNVWYPLRVCGPSTSPFMNYKGAPVHRKRSRR